MKVEDLRAGMNVKHVSGAVLRIVNAGSELAVEGDQVHNHLLPLSNYNWEECTPIVYSPWAFHEDENIKMRANQAYYQVLKEKACVMRQREIDTMDSEDYESLIQNKAILLFDGYGCAHNKYKIISNLQDLSKDELALVADGGNLCFGYRMEDGLIVVHTD